LRREAVAVFEEEMCKEVVAEQLALLVVGTIRNAILPVDLECHGRLSKRVEKKLIKFEGQHTQYNR
jgi:hypothetical protein